jgi:hypothetical protein
MSINHIIQRLNAVESKLNTGPSSGQDEYLQQKLDAFSQENEQKMKEIETNVLSKLEVLENKVGENSALFKSLSDRLSGVLQKMESLEQTIVKDKSIYNESFKQISNKISNLAKS